MNVSVGSKTDVGRRPNNEDQFFVVDVRRNNLRADGVLIIADGMGGRNFGERASHAAVQAVNDTLVEMLHADRDPLVDVGEALDAALRKANASVYELSSQGEESRGMGTTCVAAVIEGDQAHVAHAGDSRAYRWRKGRLERLTDDHSYVAEQVKAGVLSEESAKQSRFRNVITRAVGIEPTIMPDVSEHDLQGGDILLLCTDGLTNMVEEDEIARALGQATSAQVAADRLVYLANANGGRDNITAVVARMEVGNRTQRMRKTELGQAATPPAEAAPPAQPAAVTPLPPAPPIFVPSPQQFTDGYAETPVSERPAARAHGNAQLHRLRSALITTLSLVCLVLLFGLYEMTSVLTHDGYKFRASPPFAVKPPPPPTPKPPDIGLVGYAAPTLLSVVPVQSYSLTRSAVDGSLTVVSLSGQVLSLSPDGGTVYKYPLPQRFRAAVNVGTAGAVGAAPSTVSGAPVMPHLSFASDKQGNIYVADSAPPSITKFRPNGVYLRTIGAGHLHGPTALAVGDDGTVYVIDAQRLLLIHTKPAPTP